MNTSVNKLFYLQINPLNRLQTSMKQARLLFLTVAFGWAATASAQTDLKKPIPMDPKVRYGKLPNGMTYYIRKNEEPKKRAELYLINKVGAIQEEEDVYKRQELR